MITNIIYGIIIGIANIIPGVSGGTVIVLLGIFEKTMSSISNIFKKNTNKKDSIIFLIQIGIGVVSGLILFSKVLEFLFNNIPIQTMYWFIGMIIASIPIFIKKEMKNVKVSKVFLMIGVLLVGSLLLFAPAKEDLVINIFPALSIVTLLTSMVIGSIAGFFMIFPGISGSMILLIIGKYYLFKSYIANVLSFDINVIIPLMFIALGILIGIVISAKIVDRLLKRHKANTLSFILGLIAMSSIIIIPYNSNYNLLTILTSLFAFIFGYILVTMIEKRKKRR